MQKISRCSLTLNKSMFSLLDYGHLVDLALNESGAGL